MSSIVWDCGEKHGAHVNAPPVTREETPETPPEPMEGDPAGDPGWIEVHAELRVLHLEKSSTYGVDAEKFANYIAVAETTGDPPELYIAERCIEKLTRTVNQIRAGDSRGVKEWPDLSSLAICAEALRRRA